MKKKPILFSTPMVQAILEGRKKQTRRIIKPQPKDNLTFLGWKLPKYIQVAFGKGVKIDSLHKFPYGQVGDVLWVRETWQNSANNVYYHFKADFTEPGKGWKPSIFMPKDAARIWLKITNVRVERLNDISEEDAIREGSEYLLNVREWFKDLWQSINGIDSWNSNPWVWVIEFERIEKPLGL